MYATINLHYLQIKRSEYTSDMNTKLRDQRLDRRQTLATVAQAVGIDAGALSRIERGQQEPAARIVRALYRYYEGAVSYADILHAGDRDSAA